MTVILKIVVSAALIGLLLSRFDLASFSLLLDQLDKNLALLAIILLSAQYPLSAWKWQKSLQAHELDFEFGYLLRVLCVGFFFNNFLPTSIGGDAYRAYRTVAPGHSRVRSISAVVLERLLGILALIVIGIICTLILLVEDRLEHSPLMRALAASACLAALILVGIWYTKPVRRLRERIAEMPRLHNLVLSIRTVGRHPRELGMTIALSFAFQAVAILIIGILFSAVNVGAIFVQSGFIALASGVAGILPLSINGIGIMEGSFTVAALEARVPYEQAVFVALFLRFFMLASSVLFGLLYAMEPKRRDGVTGSTR